MHFKLALWRVFADRKTLLLGILISLVPILNFALYGLANECARSPNNRRMPAWHGFGSLWVSGLKTVLITAVYLVPAVAVFVLSYVILDFELYFVWASIVLGAIAYYLLPMGWISFANRHWRDAFKLGRILGLCLSWKYLGAWLVVLIATIIVMFVLQLAAIPLAITIIGPFIVAGFISFWTVIFSFTYYGQAYDELGG